MHKPYLSRKISGFVKPETLLIIAALSVLVVTLMPREESTQPSPPAPLPGASTAYQPFVFADQTTGCQYLSTHTSTGLTPRIAVDGKTHMGCKGGH